MRIPYTVPQQTLRAYQCSNETQSLRGEIGRLIKSEQQNWDAAVVTPLKILAVQALVANFSERSPLEALLTEDFHRLLESLPVDLPLEITVPLVPDGVYWKRYAEDTWNSMNVVEDYGSSWRRLVAERVLEQELEEALPAVLDEALRLSRLVGHLLRRLRLHRVLQTAPPPSGWTSDRTFECRELPMLDSELDTLREDLQTVLEYLVNLTEVDIMFGMHDFEKNLLEPPNVVKVQCCRAIGQALSRLQAFRRLRVHRSQMHVEKLEGLLEPLQESTTLTELDMRNCYLGDKGAQVLSAFVVEHPALSELRIANNKFGARGATYVAKALLQRTCAPLTELDVSLNSIGDVGGHNLMMALVPREYRQPLRDPAEDEDVRALIIEEEKEQLLRAQEAQECSEEDAPHDGGTIFRGLVARAMVSELKNEDVPRASALASQHQAEEDALLDWENEQEQVQPRTALLAGVVVEARLLQQEAVEAEAAHLEEERRSQQVAAEAAERWYGAPERLRVMHFDGCRLGPEAGGPLALLLQTNRSLNTLTVANNSLGEEACSALALALQSNPCVRQLDLRMCDASWRDQAVVERALARNMLALRQPLRLQGAIKEHEERHRAQMATATEVLGRQWERCGRAPGVVAHTSSSGLSCSVLSGASASGSTRASGVTGEGSATSAQTGFSMPQDNDHATEFSATSGNRLDVSSVSSRVSHPYSNVSQGSKPSNISIRSKQTSNTT